MAIFRKPSFNFAANIVDVGVPGRQIPIDIYILILYWVDILYAKLDVMLFVRCYLYL